MKTRVFWWFAAIVPAFACSSPEERAVHDGNGPDDTANVNPATNDDADAVIGENKQGLVQDPYGNWVPACSSVSQRCVGSYDYEFCSPSPKITGGEEWAPGEGCDNGSYCDQQGSLVQCVDDNGNNVNREVQCDEVVASSGNYLRLTINGDPRNGGLRSDPTYPQYVTYIGGPLASGNGWTEPPPSKPSSERASFGDGDGPWTYNLQKTVTDFTPYVTDSRTPANGSPFVLGIGRWDVTGACYEQLDSGSNNSWHIHRSASPGNGGGGTSNGGAGSIWCTRSGSDVLVDVQGPFNVNSRIHGTISSGVMEWAGNGTQGSWDPRRLASNGRSYVSWVNDSNKYRVVLPSGAQDFNLCFASGANAATCIWANLDNQTAWKVGGICTHEVGRTTITVH